MKIHVSTTTAPDATDAVRELGAEIERQGRAPDFISIHASAAYDIATLQAAASVWGAKALHGATSKFGVLSGGGMQSNDQIGAGAFCIWDADGQYGTAMQPLGDDPEAAAMAATRMAVENAHRPGEAPEIIWMSSAPGPEEAILKGIQSVVGTNVPILGGSAADNDGSGGWRVFDRDGIENDGVVISVLFPSGEVSFAYHSGYVPTEHSGTVTRAEGRRLYEIDGEPAAEVYDRWTGGEVVPSDITDEPAAIMLESTLKPLGRYLDSVGEIPYYLLAHPSAANPDGSIDMVADISEGDQLVQMTGHVDSLIERPGKVARLAALMGTTDADEIKGALMVICSGCMRTIFDHMDEATAGVNEALNNAPFLGVFTYGEQGMVLGNQNRHGNLMISCIVFS